MIGIGLSLKYLAAYSGGYFSAIFKRLFSRDPTLGAAVTVTRATAGGVIDHEVNYQAVPSGGARWMGARVNRNLAPASNDCTHSDWQHVIAHTTIVDYRTVDFVAATSDSWGNFSAFYKSLDSLHPELDDGVHHLVVRVALSGTPGETISIAIQSEGAASVNTNNNTLTVTLTDTPTVYSIDYENNTANPSWGPTFYVRRLSTHTANRVYIDDIQIRDATGETDPTLPGEFTQYADTDYWTKGTGWTVEDGVATHTTGANQYVGQTAGLEAKPYLLLFTIAEYASGTLAPYLGGAWPGGKTAAGDYRLLSAGAGTNEWLRFYSNAVQDFEGTLADVSCKHCLEATADCYAGDRWIPEFTGSEYGTFASAITLSGDFSITTVFTNLDETGYPRLLTATQDGNDFMFYISQSTSQVAVKHWDGAAAQYLISGTDVTDGVSHTVTVARSGTTLSYQLDDETPLTGTTTTDDIIITHIGSSAVPGNYFIGQILHLDINGYTYPLNAHNADYALADGTAVGSELVTNGDFANWTGDDPDDWAVSAEGASYYITEHADGCRIVSDGTYVYISQTVLTIGKTYLITFKYVSGTGSVLLWNGTNRGGLSSPGVSTQIITATAAGLQIKRDGICDVIVADVSAIELPSSAILWTNMALYDSFEEVTYHTSLVHDDGTIDYAYLGRELVMNGGFSTEGLDPGGMGVAGMEYYATENGTTVDASGVVTDGVGSTITPAPYLLIEPTAINLVGEPYDLSGYVLLHSSVTTDGTTAINPKHQASLLTNTLDADLVHHYAVYDQINGAWITTSTEYTAGSDWARVEHTFTTPVGCTSIRLYPMRALDAAAYVYGLITVTASTEYTFSFYHKESDAVNKVYISGVQCVAGSAALQLIESDGGATQRDIDEIHWAQTTPQTKGMLIAKLISPAGFPATGVTSRILGFANENLLAWSSGGADRLVGYDGTVFPVAISATSIQPGDQVTVYIAWESDTPRFYIGLKHEGVWYEDDRAYDLDFLSDNQLILGDNTYVPQGYESVAMYDDFKGIDWIKANY